MYVWRRASPLCREYNSFGIYKAVVMVTKPLFTNILNRSQVSFLYFDHQFAYYPYTCIQYVSRLFVQAYKIVVDSSKFTIHLMRWLTTFYDFRFKWTTTAGIGIHPTKAWLSQLVNFKNAIWRWGHFKERYTIIFCFKLGKNATETYGMLLTAFRPSCMNRTSVFEWHKRFKEGRESVKDDERCGRSKEVNTAELIGQRVRVRVTMLRF